MNTNHTTTGTVTTVPAQVATEAPAPTATVHPVAEAAGRDIPLKDTMTSLIGLGPMPLTKIIGTHGMVAEAHRHPGAGEGESLTMREQTQRDAITHKAQVFITQQVRGPIEKRINDIKALLAEINQIDRAIEVLQASPVAGPRGQQYTPAEAQHEHNMIREAIENESRDGAVKHNIKPYKKRTSYALMALDLPVFTLAMVGLLNVNLRLIGYDTQTNILAITALVFAVMGTVLLATVMHRMGARHRNYKSADGTIAAGGASRTVRAELVATTVVVALATAVMATRVISEALLAKGNPYLTYTLAGMFGALIGFTCYLNYRAEYDNGSTQTDQVQHLSATIRGRQLALDGLTNARQAKVEQAGVLIAKLHRLISETTIKANDMITASTHDKAIKLARSYHGNPTGLPDPALNNDGLDVATRQAQELTAHHQHLQPGTHEPDLFTLLTQP